MNLVSKVEVSFMFDENQDTENSYIIVHTI